MLFRHERVRTIVRYVDRWRNVVGVFPRKWKWMRENGRSEVAEPVRVVRGRGGVIDKA